MYKIEKKPYGFKLTLSGSMNADELSKWVAESETVLKAATGKFGLLVDMRNLGVLDDAAKAKMATGQKLFKRRGMERSAVILNSATTLIQLKRIGEQTGTYDCQRYINVTECSTWEKDGIDWIKNAVDPYRHKAASP